MIATQNIKFTKLVDYWTQADIAGSLYHIRILQYILCRLDYIPNCIEVELLAVGNWDDWRQWYYQDDLSHFNVCTTSCGNEIVHPPISF